MTLAEFRRAYPAVTFTVSSGKPFVYHYYKNPQAKATLALLTKPYEAHMIDFLCDAGHHFGMVREDFTLWTGRVLLILSEDDATFTPACKRDLIDLMPAPP